MLDFTPIRKPHVEKALTEYKLGRRKNMRLVGARARARTWFVCKPGSKERFDIKFTTAWLSLNAQPNLLEKYDFLLGRRPASIASCHGEPSGCHVLDSHNAQYVTVRIKPEYGTP
jgi:hypothetical protein